MELHVFELTLKRYYKIIFYNKSLPKVNNWFVEKIIKKLEKTQTLVENGKFLIEKNHNKLYCVGKDVFKNYDL